MYGNTNSVVAQQSFIQPDNFRLTRSLWFLLFTPDAGHHAALLEDDIPDVYRRVRDAVMGGTLPDDSDPEALDLLAVVTDLQTPRKLTRKRPDLVDIGDEFFTHAADTLKRTIETHEAIEWPATPTHTCEARVAVGTALIIRPDETAAARMFNPSWHTCPACYHNRVKRLSRQVLATIDQYGAMRWKILDGASFTRWAGNMRQHRKRSGADVHYRALRQADGRLFVMSTHGLPGDEVPTDKRALYDLLHPHANTPEGKRASSSRGFGGDYQRLRGDGRSVKGIRLWTDAALEQVAGALGAEVKPGRNALRVAIDQFEAFQRLSNAGVSLRVRKGQGNAMQAFLDHATDVTLKVQSDLLADYTLSVTNGAPPVKMVPEAAHTQSPLLEFTPQEVPIWPIYLR